MANRSTAKAPSEYSLAMAKLKHVLREKKITYAELASAVGMSESGVKKIFTSSDGSFQRIHEICRHAGLSVSDLFTEDDGQQVEITFTNKQQEAFLKMPELFAFYWKLVCERMPFADLCKEWALSEKGAFSLAKRLNDLNLVQLQSNGKLRIPSVKQVRWVGRGPFFKHVYQKWAKSMFEKLARPQPMEGTYFLIRYLRMRPETYHELIEAQKHIESEFVRRSIHEMRLNKTGLQHVRWMAGIDDESFVSHPVDSSMKL